MRELAYNPTQILEPWLQLNWTSNPELARWRRASTDNYEWAGELVMTLDHSINLIPAILTALDQVWTEEAFVYPPTTLNREDVEFTAQLNMYPDHAINTTGRY